MQEPFPLHAVCGSLWTNTEGQISFLKHAVSVPTDTFTFSHCSRKLVLMKIHNITHDKTVRLSPTAQFVHTS